VKGKIPALTSRDEKALKESVASGKKKEKKQKRRERKRENWHTGFRRAEKHTAKKNRQSIFTPKDRKANTTKGKRMNRARFKTKRRVGPRDGLDEERAKHVAKAKRSQRLETWIL